MRLCSFHLWSMPGDGTSDERAMPGFFISIKLSL